MKLHKDLKGLVVIGELLENPAIPDFSVRLFATIVRRSCKNGSTFAHNATLAADLGRPAKLVSVHIYKLEELGMIVRRIRKKDGARTVYYIEPQPPSEWRIPDSQNDQRGDSRWSKSPSADSQNDHRVYTKKEKVKIEKKEGVFPSVQIGFDQVGEAPKDCKEFEFLQAPIPAEWIADKPFRELWFDWLEIKRKHKPKPSAAMMKTCRRRLEKYSPTLEIAKENLESAIAGGWKTFYPQKDFSAGGSNSSVDIPDEFS